MLQNKTLLLALLAVLVFIRFGIVPWHAYQQQQYQQLDAVTKRLQRSQALLQQQQQLQQWQAQQQQEVSALLAPYPMVSSASDYRLQLQQQLQQLAAANSVSVTFFDWLSDTPLQVFNLVRGRISLRLQGPAGNIMLVHSLIEQQFSHFNLRDIKANWRADLNAQSDVELSLLIEADYCLQEAL
jgi:hypothetical protein